MIIKAVLFDMGNTLIDFESRPALELHAQAELAVRDALIRGNGRGATIPEPAAFLDAFRSVWSRLAERHRPVGGQPTLAEAIREVGDAFDLALAHEDVERLETAHYAVIREQIRLYPEVHAVLDRLADLGVKRALVSNTIWQARDHREDLARLGLTDRFEHAVFSSEFGRMKPHPSIFQLSLDAFGVAAHEIEQFVINEIRAIGIDDNLIGEVVSQSKTRVQDEVVAHKKQLRLLQKELASYQARLEPLSKIPQPDELQLASLREKIAITEHDITVATFRLKELQNHILTPTDIRVACGHFSPLWDTLSSHEQWRMLSLLLDRVEFDADRETIDLTFAPDGVKTLNQLMNEKYQEKAIA